MEKRAKAIRELPIYSQMLRFSPDKCFSCSDSSSKEHVTLCKDIFYFWSGEIVGLTWWVPLWDKVWVRKKRFNEEGLFLEYGKKVLQEGSAEDCWKGTAAKPNEHGKKVLQEGQGVVEGRLGRRRGTLHHQVGGGWMRLRWEEALARRGRACRKHEILQGSNWVCCILPLCFVRGSGLVVGDSWYLRLKLGQNNWEKFMKCTRVMAGQVSFYFHNLVMEL